MILLFIFEFPVFFKVSISNLIFSSTFTGIGCKPLSIKLMLG
ncbi:conserved hypothetical protein [delta proteobacterium NaphS2]|nr:conserved hypothetical protein [delta proteobacterium NaphS2]